MHVYYTPHDGIAGSDLKTEEVVQEPPNDDLMVQDDEPFIEPGNIYLL